MNTALGVFTDADAMASLQRATRLVMMLGAVGVVAAWMLAGWQSAALLFVGAAISVTGLWEWRRLMRALIARMDAMPGVAMEASGSGAVAVSEDAFVVAEDAPVQAPSIGFAIAGFVLRLAVVLVVLYASLKYLHGSVIALAAGLGLAVVSLTVEGLRLLRSGVM